MKNFALLVLAIFLFGACTNTSSKKGEEKSASNKNVTLTAAGATFPMPYYNLVFKAYTSKTGTLLNYGGIGFLQYLVLLLLPIIFPGSMI